MSKLDPNDASRGSMDPIDTRTTKTGAKAGAILIIVALFIFLGFFITNNNEKEKSVKEEPQPVRMPSYSDINLDLPPEKSKPEPVEVEETVVTLSELREENFKPELDPILQRRMKGGFSSLPEGSSVKENQANTDNTIETSSTTDLQPKNTDTDYDSQGVAKVSASLIGNRSLIITQGTKIQCTLETALDSTIPGMTRCIIGEDVYSSNGKVRLIDRGSKLNGRYESSMKRGQVRIGILWERLETPDGVLVNITSPSIDTLGRAGTGGYVDNHFWERFGNALLFSFIDDAFSYLEKTSKDSSTENIEENTHELASDVLENEINIPPTLHKNQGEAIMVFLNKDLSFENVYDLSLGAKTPESDLDKSVKGYLYK